MFFIFFCRIYELPPKKFRFKKKSWYKAREIILKIVKNSKFIFLSKDMTT